MNVSRDMNMINAYAEMSLPGVDDQGRKLASAIDSYITSDPNYGATLAARDYRTNMEKYQIEGGNLGFISYEILDYIVKQKIKSRYDTTSIDKTQLDIRLLDVSWTPYEKIDALSIDDRTNSYNPYYYRGDDLTYHQLTRDISFAYANKNLGGVYKYDSTKVLSMDGGRGTIAAKHGLPNLDLLNMFVTEWHNPTRVDDNVNKTYLFRDTYNETGEKTLPHIGGEIYLDNDEAVNEYNLYTLAKTYTDELIAMTDTPLTICAKTVTPCARAKFIEIMQGPEIDDTSDGYAPNGDLSVIATYRSNDPAATVVPPKAPLRNTYDFRGWATEEAVMEYGAAEGFLVKDGERIVSNTGGICSTESPLLDHLAVRVLDVETGETASDALVFGDDQVNYYAVFTLHKYKAKYILDTNLYSQDPTNPNSYEIQMVPSGAIIQNYPPEHIPFIKHDSLPLNQMHDFIGWNSDAALAREAKVEKLDYAIHSDMEFYPVYQVVTNARNNPLKEDYFMWTSFMNYDAGEQQVIIYGLTRKVGGRICIPSHIQDMPVVQIVGAGWNTRPAGWNGTNTI